MRTVNKEAIERRKARKDKKNEQSQDQTKQNQQENMEGLLGKDFFKAFQENSGFDFLNGKKQ